MERLVLQAKAMHGVSRSVFHNGRQVLATLLWNACAQGLIKGSFIPPHAADCLHL